VTGDHDDAPLAPLTGALGYNLRRAQLGFRKHFLASTAELGLRLPDVGALTAIGAAPGLTPTALSLALGLEPAQVATLLNALERRGLVERRVATADARSRQVYLTVAGRAQYRVLRRITPRLERSFVAGRLSAPELHTLVDLLGRLIDDGPGLPPPRDEAPRRAAAAKVPASTHRRGR
jgi:DNA-binding MarR family transcriptional regulator